tara:strand:+ start:372 stop:767 length:396 start_codon:yes stop_codon:yes gene_type:complete
MAFINPLTISLGAKVAASIGKKYGPKVLAKLKDMTSKKNLTENLLGLGILSSQLAQLKLMPKYKGDGRAAEIRKMRREAREKFARRGDMGEPEKSFKETKTKVKMDGVKKLDKGGLVSVTKYFKHKVNKDN